MGLYRGTCFAGFLVTANHLLKKQTVELAVILKRNDIHATSRDFSVSYNNYNGHKLNVFFLKRGP